jgi:hypothetical protein
MVLLPFIPIPIVLVVLALKAASPGGLNKSEKLAEADDDTEANRDESRIQNGNGEKPTTTTPFTTSGRIKGEPKTGFGPTPVGEREILETALVILIPAALLTFEQGVRCAQAFHVPKAGEKTPWVRDLFCVL